MGVSKSDLPTLRAILPADMKKYASPTAAADLTIEIIGKFVDDVNSGAIKPHLKSEPVPEKNHVDGLTVVVGT